MTGKEAMFEKITAAVLEAGAIMKNASVSEHAAKTKSSSRDVVTAQDVAIQRFLFDRLGGIVPDARFVSEENQHNPAISDGFWFIIDPIDGTANYAEGLGHSCVSVGLVKDGEQYFGAVYDPYLDEMFTAKKGGGAFLNGAPVRASDKPLKYTLAGFGTCPYDLERAGETFALARAVFESSMDLRRSGTSALDICYCACGRFGVFFEPILYPWDYAAASLIVKEAGGRVTDLHGEPYSLTERSGIAAGGVTAHAELLEIIKRTLG